MGLPKDEFIRLRVAGWEKHWISHKAEKAQMTVSEFVRKAAMDKNVVVLEFSDELMTELRRQGNNLNQLTAMAHMGRIQQINYEPFLEVYNKTWQALSSCLSRVV